MSVEHAQCGDVAVLTLSRPGALNAINLELLDELVARLGEVSAAACARLVGEGSAGACAPLVGGGRPQSLVLTGAGGLFCAGADLQFVRGALAASDASQALTPLVDALHAAVRAIRALPIPTIAAVEGAAVGAGIGLALACDLHVLGRGAQFVPGYLRIGASPDGGVSWLLSRAVGGTRAASILLQGRPLDAERCLALGLADAVVTDGGALDEALGLAGRLAGTAPRALVSMRALTERAEANTLDEHLDLERSTVMSLWGGPDFREGVTAFLEKRRPRFTGS